MNKYNNEIILNTVLHIRKVKTIMGSKNVISHNLRQSLNKSLKEQINPNLSYLNIYEGIQDQENFIQKYDEMIKKANITRKIQVNASRCIEFFFSFSPDFSSGWKEDKELKEKIINYFKDCKNFIFQKYGNVIISTAIHFDETTPHIHILCIPLIYSKDDKECKFSSSTFLGGIKGLKNMHTDFHNIVGKKYGLSRGIEGSRAKHIDLKKYKAQEEQKLIELEKEKKYIEKTKKETEEIKSNVHKLQNDLMKRDVEFSKKEKELLAIKTDIPCKIPEIPIPPLNITEKSRNSWKDNVQKIVNDSFNIIINAYQAIQYKFNRLKENFEYLSNDYKNIKKRAENAEKDLMEKPIDEIKKTREMNKKKKDEGRSSHDSHSM